MIEEHERMTLELFLELLNKHELDYDGNEFVDSDSMKCCPIGMLAIEVIGLENAHDICNTLNNAGLEIAELNVVNGNDVAAAIGALVGYSPAYCRGLNNAIVGEKPNLDDRGIDDNEEEYCVGYGDGTAIRTYFENV